MPKKLKRKYGVVAVLDALGAANYSDAQIKQFLSAREDVNSTIRELAKDKPRSDNFCEPSIFTFGDTIIITTELRSKKFIRTHLTVFLLLLRRYLFHSLQKHILFRGAFSIDYYFEDAGSNTVLGAAVADAASWYARSEWMGISSTPKTNSMLEYHFYGGAAIVHDNFVLKYGVPLRDGTKFALYAISWPGAFFDNELLKEAQKQTPEKWFLELLKDIPVPRGTEAKYENTKTFFGYVQKALEKK
jgi:hypothetical protein